MRPCVCYGVCALVLVVRSHQAQPTYVCVQDRNKYTYCTVPLILPMLDFCKRKGTKGAGCFIDEYLNNIDVAKFPLLDLRYVKSLGIK